MLIGGCLADLSALIVAAVLALLAATLLRQFGQLGPRGQWLDVFALLPQWKFFGQQRVDAGAIPFADWHLLARRGDDGGSEVLCWDERPALRALWDPGGAARFAVYEHVLALGRGSAGAEITTSLAYLVVLRHCFDHLPGAEPLQFAVSTTHGRDNPAVQIAFLSAWHLP